MGKFVSALYDWAAEYGQNFVRPLLWMMFVSVVFYGVYYGLLFFLGAPLSASACEFDFPAFTLRQVFRPFEVWSSRPDLIDPFVRCGFANGPPMFLRLLATAQTLVIYGLFTLFLLALRKRFRML